MRYYIATGLANHAQHNRLMAQFTVMGHHITYDWTTHGPVRDKGLARIKEVAELETSGVSTADFIVVLLPRGLNTSQRGTHAELGMAIALGKPVVIWSDQEALFGATKETCAFYHHPQVLQLHSPEPDASDIVKLILKAT